MHRSVPPNQELPPSQGQHVPAPRRVTTAALLRSAVAAGGAVAGVAVAIPVGAVLAMFLFEHVGTAVVEGIMSEATDGRSGIEAAIVAVMLAIAAIMVAVLVVVALVAPVFVVLPMLGAGLALRLTRAGLILRSLWLSLAALAVLVGGVAGVLSLFEVRGPWWLWMLVVALASFVGRLTVEARQPQRAAVRSSAALGKRWLVLVIVWICLVGVAIVLGVVLFATSGVDQVPWITPS